VVVVLEVAELVHDDIVDAADGCLDEIEVQWHPTSGHNLLKHL
jgi:hypothetical protein